MSNIIQLSQKPKEPLDPHGSGEAFCIQCGHTWIAVAPIGSVDLECPECRTMKGKWRFEFQPAPSTMVREFDCGNQLFYLTPDGHLCANCWVYQGY